MKFRKLKAEEIECRVQTIKNTKTSYGVSLLLYKDARVDQRMLDEEVGPMNWQRKHTRDNANCIVSIWDEDKKRWIEKEDTGTESNTEAEKGLASDSFKRACFNWGIGRELYTAPFIWVTNCEIKKNAKGKDVCYDRFYVSKIEYDEAGDISALDIRNAKTHVLVFSTAEPVKMKSIEKPDAGADRSKKLEYIEKLAWRIESIDGLLKTLKLSSLDDLEDERIEQVIAWCEGLLEGKE